MKAKLITALRITANALEQGTFDYSWDKRNKCNCGSLFCALTGRTPYKLSMISPTITGKKAYTWANLVGEHCPIAGITKDKLFLQLQSYGLSPNDIVDLEYLKGNAVAQRMISKRPWYKRHRKLIDHSNKYHAAEYMRAWAEILTEEGKQDHVEQATSYDKQRTIQRTPNATTTTVSRSSHPVEGAVSEA